MHTVETIMEIAWTSGYRYSELKDFEINKIPIEKCFEAYTRANKDYESYGRKYMENIIKAADFKID